jgi:hypothetical protein
MSAIGLMTLFGAPTPSWARPDDRNKSITAQRTSLPPRIDGHLDDAAWQLVPGDDRFTQNFPKETAAPTERTELRIVYDDEALYIAVRCWDRDARSIVRRLTRRDRDTDADKVQIDISSTNDHLSAFHFDVNVSGVKLDGFRFNDTQLNQDWDDILWDAATSQDAAGWSAELMIPLRTLRYDGKVTRFGFQARRIIQRRGEIDEWAYIPRTASGEVAYYGSVEGITGLRAHRLFQLLPYFTTKLTVLSNQAPLNGLYPSWNIGGDVKLGITPALILDATVNPDFGQIEADLVILNLTTFEIFYPERRPFFLEGAELFNTPFTQFYTRRIGHSPDAPTLSGNDQLLQPLPNEQILFAAKLTGLVTRRLTIAALEALTSPASMLVGPTPDRPRSIQLDPLTNFAVLRLRRDFGHNSSIGVTGTTVNRFDGDSSDSVTGLCPDGGAPGTDKRCTHDAYTGGIDVKLTTKGGTWGASAHAVTSLLSRGPTRALYDGTQLGPGAFGWGVNAEAGKYGGEHWLFNVGYLGASPKLHLDDAGYMQQANLHQMHISGSWRTTHPHGALQETELQVGARYNRSWDGAELFRRFYLSWDVRWRSLWETWIECDYDLDHDDNREARDGTFVERVGSSGCDVELRSDSRRKVVVMLGDLTTRTRNGFDTWFYGTLRLRPAPSVELDVIPNLRWSFGDPRWFDTVTASNGNRLYYFGYLDARDFDVTVRGTYTFTPKLSLQIFGQVFIASGHYGPLFSATPDVRTHPRIALRSLTPAAAPDGVSADFREGTINLNAVFRWEFRPGCTLLLVYAHQHQQTGYDPTTEPIARWRFDRFSGGAYSDIVQAKVTFLLD